MVKYVGPCGQAGYALLQLGRISTTLFPLISAKYPDREGLKDLALIGPAMYGAGLVWGLLFCASHLTFFSSSVGLIRKSDRYRGVRLTCLHERK